MCGECEWISEIVSQPPQEAAEAIEADGRLELPPARLLTSSLQSWFNYFQMFNDSIHYDPVGSKYKL